MQTLTKGPTFEELSKIEPLLTLLYHEAQEVPRLPYWEANKKWYREFKPRLVELVGMCSMNPDETLHTSPAYDVAYLTIYHALMKLESEE